MRWRLARTVNLSKSICPLRSHKIQIIISSLFGDRTEWVEWWLGVGDEVTGELSSYYKLNQSIIVLQHHDACWRCQHLDPCMLNMRTITLEFCSKDTALCTSSINRWGTPHSLICIPSFSWSGRPKNIYESILKSNSALCVYSPTQ